MLSVLAVKRVSKLNHELEDGQPSERLPVPPYTTYPPRSFREEASCETPLERKDRTGAPEMRVEKLPAAKIKGRTNMMSRVERVVKQRYKRRQP